PVELQVSIVRAISWIEIPQALKYLQQASQLRSLPVCREIVLVLGRVEKAELQSIAAAILSNLLASNNPVFQQPEIKQALALGLGQLGAVEQRESLNKLLQDPDSKVRLHASTALKKLGLST
ncbi:MAG: HEAT repeat domain-containing protein, partial [Prochloraceae cyanobacterium]